MPGDDTGYMRIRSIFHPSVTSARADDTLTRAATVMRLGSFGALPVYDGDRLIGIFSERDLVAAIADHSDPDRATVRDWMTAETLVADPEEDSREIAERMAEAGIRHLPVVEAGRLVGMVSARDLLRGGLAALDDQGPSESNDVSSR